MSPSEAPSQDVVIFGAGSGLGKALSDVYRAHGHSVLGLTRESCDLSDPRSVSAWLGKTLASGISFSKCIFAAGNCHAGLVSALPPEAFTDSFQVNFFAPLTAMHGLFGAGRCRRFVFVLSGAADFLMPGLSPYALSKRALRDFLYFLELENATPGISVLKVWPGPMASDFNRNAHLYGGYHLPLNQLGRTPFDVAQRIYQADRLGAQTLVLSNLPRVLGKIQGVCGNLSAILLRFYSRMF